VTQNTTQHSCHPEQSEGSAVASRWEPVRISVGAPAFMRGRSASALRKAPRSNLSGFSLRSALVRIYSQEHLQFKTPQIQIKRKISQEPHPRTSKGCGTTSNPVQVRERVRRPPMRRYDWIFRRFLVRFERRRCRSNEEYFVRGSFQRTPLPMKNGRKSSRSFTDGSDFLRTIAPYQQVTSSDASFLGSCAVGVPPSFCASEITSLT